MTWQARIDRELCIGSGNCTVSAPDAFDVDDNGLAVALVPGSGDGTFDVNDAWLADVREAVLNCPGRALSLLRDGTPAEP
jgi:ferredoxin